MKKTTIAGCVHPTEMLLRKVLIVWLKSGGLCGNMLKWVFFRIRDYVMAWENSGFPAESWVEKLRFSDCLLQLSMQTYLVEESTHMRCRFFCDPNGVMHLERLFTTTHCKVLSWVRPRLVIFRRRPCKSVKCSCVLAFDGVMLAMLRNQLMSFREQNENLIRDLRIAQSQRDAARWELRNAEVNDAHEVEELQARNSFARIDSKKGVWHVIGMK